MKRPDSLYTHIYNKSGTGIKPEYRFMFQTTIDGRKIKYPVAILVFRFQDKQSS